MALGKQCDQFMRTQENEVSGPCGVPFRSGMKARDVCTRRSPEWGLCLVKVVASLKRLHRKAFAQGEGYSFV